MLKKVSVKAGGELISRTAPGLTISVIVDSETGDMYVPLMSTDALKGGVAAEATPAKAGRGTPAAAAEAPADAAAPKGRGRGAAAAPAETAATSVAVKDVSAVLAKVESNTIGEAAAIKELLALVASPTKAQTAGVTASVKKFMADETIPAADIAKEVTGTLNGGAAEAPKGRGRGAAAPTPVEEVAEEGGELVAVEDLKAGDRVSVMVDTGDPDTTDAYPAVVAVLRGGKIQFNFDDGDKQAYDPEVHTEISYSDEPLP